jgi:hypothetical protein
MKNLGIKDKVVVITGASNGIGEATAVMLAERGTRWYSAREGWIGCNLSLVGSKGRVGKSPMHKLT